MFWPLETKIFPFDLATGLAIFPKDDFFGKLPPWVSFSITPYDLRHSFCTWCRDHGVEMNTCIKWMGHADAQMILKIYDSVSDARFRREAAKLDSTFAEPPNVTTFPKAE